MASEISSEEKKLHLLGLGVQHSIAPPMHNFIAKSLGLPWTFYSTECVSVQQLLDIGRDTSTAGLVVTMPYKTAVMPLLDSLDDIATAIGACNNVHWDPKDRTKLRGTNTDWLGIRGCLLEKGDEARRPKAGDKSTLPGLIIGAGGASRAAVYALAVHLHCTTIYVLNRDDDEVTALRNDVQNLRPTPTIIHVKSVDQAKTLGTPYYVVGTIPDFEPKTEQEKVVAAALEEFLARPERGVLLDMCFKPRRTRTIKLAERLGWPTVEGTHVIGYQIERQWSLWTGEDVSEKLDKKGAWNVLLEAAEASTHIN